MNESFSILGTEDISSFPVEVGVVVDASHGVGRFVQTTSSVVVYQLELRKKVTSGLDVMTGRGGLDRAFNDAMGVVSDSVRRNVNCLLPPVFKYDMRAVAYYLGYLSSLCLKGEDWPSDCCDVIGTSPAASGIDACDIVYVPSGDGQRETVYVLSLACEAVGKKRLFVHNEQFIKAKKPKTTAKRMLYVHLAIRSLLADAAECGLYGDHCFAFYRGLSCGVTVRSHSDEGGWVREAMRNASYPQSRGVVKTDPRDYPGLPRFNTMNTDPSLFRRECVSLMLEVSALISDSDPLHEVGVSSVIYNAEMDKDGKPTAAAKVGGDHMKPSAFDDLEGILSQMENYAVKFLSVINASAPSDGCNGALLRGTFRMYLESDSVDSHFDRLELLPYLFVEPGPIIKHKMCVRQSGPKAGETRKVPLFPSDPYILEADDKRKTCTEKHRAANVYYDYKDTSLRDIGAYYMLSPGFNSGVDRGLNNMRFVSTENVSDHVTMMRTSATDCVAEMAWIRPHCPVPAPGEGRCWSGQVVLEYHGGMRRALRTAADDPVYLEVGSPIIRCVQKLNKSTTAMSRKVNDKYRKYINDANMDETELLTQELFRDRYTGVTPRLAVQQTVGVGASGDPTDERLPGGDDAEGDKSTAAVREYGIGTPGGDGSTDTSTSVVGTGTGGDTNT